MANIDVFPPFTPRQRFANLALTSRLRASFGASFGPSSERRPPRWRAPDVDRKSLCSPAWQELPTTLRAFYK